MKKIIWQPAPQNSHLNQEVLEPYSGKAREKEFPDWSVTRMQGRALIHDVVWIEALLSFNVQLWKSIVGEVGFLSNAEILAAYHEGRILFGQGMRVAQYAGELKW